LNESTLAAVDIGTNSTRLLVAQGTRRLERRAVITRLGAGVARSGRFEDDAVARTVSCLTEFRRTIDTHRVEGLRVVATAAARQVSNRDEFLDAAEKILGARPEVLSGEDEGRLAFAGATDGLDPGSGPFCVLDIGGGSTEFSVGVTEPDAVVSIELGSVSLTEDELTGDPPRPEELANALGRVTDEIDDVVRAVPDILHARLIGVAGTVTTVAAVEIGLEPYDPDRIHQFVLTRRAAEDVFRTLATERRSDRVHNPGLQAERADIIVGGCCILVAVMRRLEAAELLVSEHDLLDGLLESLG
jgi:exopolyphosphatase / guanosine-5'-triphosphate,3'-diphosphate pyrophosphatase